MVVLDYVLEIRIEVIDNVFSIYKQIKVSNER